MSLQKRINVAGASAIKDKAVLVQVGEFSKQPMPHREARDIASVVLPVLRFIAAAHSTGEAECRETAFHVAANEVGAKHGPLLVGYVAAFVRLIRRSHEVVCLPAPCSRLSVDEQQIITMIGAAGDSDWLRFVRVATPLGDADVGDLAGVAKAIFKIISDASRPNASMRSIAAQVPRIPGSGWSFRTTLLFDDFAENFPAFINSFSARKEVTIARFKKGLLGLL